MEESDSTDDSSDESSEKLSRDFSGSSAGIPSTSRTTTRVSGGGVFFLSFFIHAPSTLPSGMRRASRNFSSLKRHASPFARGPSNAPSFPASPLSSSRSLLSSLSLSSGPNPFATSSSSYSATATSTPRSLSCASMAPDRPAPRGGAVGRPRGCARGLTAAMLRCTCPDVPVPRVVRSPMPLYMAAPAVCRVVSRRAVRDCDPSAALPESLLPPRGTTWWAMLM